MIKFVIVAEIRTGYKYLASCLRSHPNAFCFGEVFGSNLQNRIDSLIFPHLPPIQDGDDSVAYTNNTIIKYAENNHLQAVGFKLNYVCARQPAWAPLWDHIRDENWKVIHLTRRNLLDRVLSERLAVHENNWSDNEYLTKISLDPKYVRLSIERSLQWQKETEEFFPEILRVTYEKLTTRPQTLNRIQKFLGIDVQELNTTIKKQRTRKQRDYIENYEDLTQQFPECARFFDREIRLL